MKYYLPITLIKHSSRENDELTFGILVSFVCILLILTIYRPDKQYIKLKNSEITHSYVRKLLINTLLWIGAIFGTYFILKKIINY